MRHVDVSSLETEMIIGGESCPAVDGARTEVIDPFTAAPITTVANADVKDGLAAVDAAAAAAEAWAATTTRDRGELLRRAFQLMIDRAEWFAEIIVCENGKALVEARAEVAYAAEFLRWFSEEAVRNTGSLSMGPTTGHRVLVGYQPVGVSLLVTPGNFPLAMAARKLGPALAAGCTAILKPAPETPLSALAAGRLLAEAGVPPGVVNVLPSDRSAAVVRAMMEDPRVRKLSFTGSTEVGRILLGQAAGSVMNCSMELGGNAPFIVFADADLDAAVSGAMLAKMRNGGESCTAANRFYVEEPVAEEFTRRFTDAMAAVRVGPPLEEATELGPLISEEGRAKVVRLVGEAVDAGARIRLGAEVPDGTGFFYPPTVLDRVPLDAAMLHQEIFGPVAPILTFSDTDEMIRQANDTEYGLVTYLYTGDLRRGLAMAEALDTGMVGLNRGLVSDPAVPFGGVKQSGIGREGGHEGLLGFLESKYVATEW